jgi:hypothetical protein
LHHTLTTALADLVDNSVDACAKHVLVRFVQAGTQITAVRIVDDGVGMSAEDINAAMQYGRARSYSATDQGHFGVGLKASSLSQADTLTVYSRSAAHDAQGRTVAVRARDDEPELSYIEHDKARNEIDSAAPRFPFTTGTIVEWRRLRTFPTASDAAEQISWLETTIDDVRNHLGVVFHRLIDNGLRLTIDVYDAEAGRAGAPRSVPAIDPVGYPRTGHPDYPCAKPLTTGGISTTVALHVWPARSNLAAYKLFGAPGRERQGLYVYRNDRLLQPGGWNNVVRFRPEYGLARVVIELDDRLISHVTINPEKAGVTLDAALSLALGKTLAAGYLEDAESVMKAARKFARRPISVVEPESGLPEEVLDEFSDAFGFTAGSDPVSLRWRALAREQFFEVDLKERTLWINARFRRDLLGYRSADNTDAPVVRTLLYLLTEDMFDAVRHSSRQIAQMHAWQDVLVAAMAAHREQQERRL